MIKLLSNIKSISQSICMHNNSYTLKKPPFRLMLITKPQPAMFIVKSHSQQIDIRHSFYFIYVRFNGKLLQFCGLLSGNFSCIKRCTLLQGTENRDGNGGQGILKMTNLQSMESLKRKIVLMRNLRICRRHYINSFLQRAQNSPSSLLECHNFDIPVLGIYADDYQNIIVLWLISHSSVEQHPNG